MKKIFFAIALFSICLYACAQDVDNDTLFTHSVDIEKAYTPELTKVKRTDIVLPSKDPKIEKQEVVYSDETAPMEVESQFYPLQATEIKNVSRPTYKPSYARIALGFPIEWMADLWYPIINKKTDYLDVTLDHYGIWNNNKRLVQTDFDIRYNHSVSKGQLYTVIGFENNYYNYFGVDSIFSGSSYYLDELKRDIADIGLVPDARNNTGARATLGFRSEKELNGWSYDAHIDYNFLTTHGTIRKDGVKINQADTREHKIVAALGGGYNVKGHHILADLSLESYIYNTPSRTVYMVDSVTPSKDRILRDSVFTGEKRKPQFLITFNPRYEKTWFDALSLRVGAKLWFSINKGQVFSASPDVLLSYNFRDIFNVYGGVGGDYSFASLARTLKQNRYYDVNLLDNENDYTPLDFYAGFNVKPVHGLMIDASVSYKMINSISFFYNQSYACTNTPNVYPKSDLEYVYAKVFTEEEAKARLLTAEVRVAYNLKERYNFHVKGRYNGWNVLTDGVQAWNMPKWEADAGVEALLTKNFALNANFYYASECLAKIPTKDGSFSTAKLAPIYDLNFSMSYTFKKNWSLFLQANNLLSVSEKLRYQEWYGYDNIGFNILVGATISF